MNGLNPNPRSYNASTELMKKKTEKAYDSIQVWEMFLQSQKKDYQRNILRSYTELKLDFNGHGQ